MNKQELINIIENFNLNEIKEKIEDESRLLFYNKVLSICLHIINGLSIILSIISNTVNINIIYAVMIINIANSILNYEILKLHTTLQNNTKIINQYLKTNNINENIYNPTDITTPTPTLINA